MDWNPTETVTIGGIFVGIVILLLGIVKIIGQRTDPQLLTFMTTLTESNKEAFDRLAGSIDKSNAALDSLKNGVESTFRGLVARIEISETNALKQNNEVVEVFRAFRNSVQKEHSSALGAIQAIPAAIAPAIQELTAQQAATKKQSEGFKRVMDDTLTTQNKTNGEILKALQRIQQTLDDIKREFPERIEKVEQDVNALKADIVKAKRQPPPIVTPDQVKSGDSPFYETGTYTNSDDPKPEHKPKPKEDKD